MADYQEGPAFSSDEGEGAKPNKRRGAKTTTKAQPADKAQPNKSSAIHGSSFRDFQLRNELVRGIGEAGFEHPSEGSLRSPTRRNSLHSLRG